MDKGIKASRIIIGGFSQGGAMSVFSGLTSKEKLGGVFGLSCYLLLSDRIKNYLPEEWANKKTPFFLAHGEDDEVVPLAFGQKSADLVKEIGLENVSFNKYPYVTLRCLAVGLDGFLICFAVISATPPIPRRLTIWRSSWRSLLLITLLLAYDLETNQRGNGNTAGLSAW